MNAPAKLAAFTLGLGAVFGAALGVGSLVGPVGPAVVEQPAMTPDTADTDPGDPHGRAADTVRREDLR